MHHRTPVVALLFALVALFTNSSVPGWAQPADSQSKPKSTHTDSATDKSTSSKTKVDLNHATAEELESLPGIGPSTAQAIIKARPFKNINELTNVTGIGPSKFANLKSHVTAKPLATGKAPRSETHSQTSAGGSSTKEKSNTSPSATSASSSQHERTSGSSSTAAGSTRTLGQKINLNTATLEELQELPGIGPVKAQAIIDGRPFSTIEDVMKVKGIKEGTFDKMKDQITVR
jgi:competence protein ComEA